MSQKEVRYAVCPFYQSVTDREIVCEGLANAAETRLSFSSREKRDGYCREFCYALSRFRKCRLAATLYRQYDDEA